MAGESSKARFTGIRAFLSQLRSGKPRAAHEALSVDARHDVELLAAYLRTAGLDELSALGGVHMHLRATGALDDLHAITRRMSKRLQAEGRMDLTAIAIRQGVMAARHAIGTALRAAPMRASADLESDVLEAASDLGALLTPWGPSAAACSGRDACYAAQPLAIGQRLRFDHLNGAFAHSSCLGSGHYRGIKAPAAGKYEPGQDDLAGRERLRGLIPNRPPGR
jgi:hypothetical protein